MSESLPSPGDHLDDPVSDDPAAGAIAEYFELVDRGERVDREAFMARHSDVADLLREFFVGANLVEQFAGPTFAEQTIRLSLADTARSQIIDETIPGLSPSQIAAGGTGLPHEPYRDMPVPEQLGRYRLRHIIGRGAMGTVYLAHDEQLHRDVALKIPRFEVDGSRDELMQRFFREARSVALLRDAGICPVYDVDEVDGIHFITMAYIDGQPLSYLLRDGQNFESREAAVLVLKVARALCKAHAHGIVHRDVKPGNIMIDRDGEPVIMDFGLAARLDIEDVRVTQHGTLLGTPAYMSPEQVAGDPDAISRSSDIFSLGVILYELLAGRLPFEGTILSIAHQIAHDEPPRLSDLNPRIDAPLEVICSRMLAKSPQDRFGSMDDTATALREYLVGCDASGSDRSVSSETQTAATVPAQSTNPTDADYLSAPASDATSRRPGITLGLTALVLLSALLVGFTDGGRVMLTRLEEAVVPFRSAPTVPPQTETRTPSIDTPADPIAEPHVPPAVSGLAFEQPDGSPIRDLVVSDDGRFLVTGSAGGDVQLWDAESGQLIHEHHSGSGADDSPRPAITSLAMSPGGHLLGVAAGSSVIVWSTHDGQLVYRNQPGGAVLDVAFSPDGEFLLTSTDQGDMQLWMAATGELERRFQPVPYAIRAVGFSPDGRYIFSGEYRPLPDATSGVVLRGRRLFKQWNVDTGELLRIFHGETGNVRALDVAPDGRSLLTGGEDGVIRRWDLDNGQVVREFQLQGAITDVSHSPDGRYFVACAANEPRPRIWQIATAREVPDRSLASVDQSLCIEFASDGRLVFVGGYLRDETDGLQQGLVRRWELESRLHTEPAAAPPSLPTPHIETAIAQPLQRFRGHTDEVLDIEFVNGGRAAFSVGRDGTIRHWGIAVGRLLNSFDPQSGPIRDLAMSPDERFLATAHQDGAVNLFSASSAELQLRLDGHRDPVDSLDFSADGKRLASAGRDGFVRIWNVDDGSVHQELRADPVANWTVRFLAGDRLFAAGERHSRLWDLSTGSVSKTFGTNNQLYYGAEPAPDGQRVVFGNYDGQIGVWNFDGQASGVLIGQHSRFVSLSKELAGDGRFAVTGGAEAVLVTDLQEGNTVYRLNLGAAGAGVLALSPDERFLLVTARDPHLEDGPGFALQLFELPRFVRKSGRE